MQFPAWLCLPLIVFTYSTRTILWLLLLVFRSTKNNVDNVAQNLLVALRNICCLFDSGAHHKMSSLSSPATGSLQIKWDPKNLEIRTKSVEKTLEPLVTQVCFPFLSPYFTVHRDLCFYCVSLQRVSIASYAKRCISHDRFCLTVCHSPVSCQNDSSYDHAVFTGG